MAASRLLLALLVCAACAEGVALRPVLTATASLRGGRLGMSAIPESLSSLLSEPSLSALSSSISSLSLSAVPPALLARDTACAVVCALAAKLWVSLWSELAAADRIDPKLSRKIIHTSSAPLFMLCWPLFSDAPTARLLASAVPMLQMMRLYRAGEAATANSPDAMATKDAALVKAISRSGERSEARGGPFLYTVVLFSATLLGWRSPLATTAVCQMAVGDGIADIIGRRFGKVKWPFSKSKSFAGSAAFVAGGFAASLGFVALFHTCGFTSLTPVGAAPTLLLVSLTCAAVELLPSEIADDNLSVPLTAWVLAFLLLSRSF